MEPRQDVVLKRRAVLVSVLAIGANSLGSCSLWPRRPVPACPTSPDISLPSGPLTIDAHCHVFNGTDLQITEFFSKVAVQQDSALGAGARVLGSLLQELAWSVAPNGQEELAELRKIGDALASCSETQLRYGLAALRQSGYGKGRKELQTALRRSPEFRVLQDRLRSSAMPLELDEDSNVRIDAIRLIEGLPEDVDVYRAGQRTRDLRIMSLKDRSVTGLIDFVLQNFQYRYVSVHDYLSTYNQPGIRVVDLMLPSLVDYDWWLAKGSATLTSLQTQVDVMRQLAVLTGGRVHCFVPYDPLRQVAFELGHESADSFALVVDAIQKHGCVGVKLYPPMGFAALGNSSLRGPGGTNFWAREWLPAWTADRDLGERLDRAMAKLLSWCELNGVPVMAHTGLSNGVTPDFERLAGSPYWANALKAFPNLRVSFGHFGDSSPVEDGLDRARAFAGLMNGNSGQPGAFAYADAGYFVEVMNSQPELLANLRQLYDETAGKGSAALANRFMYGTDWEMTLTEGSVGTYLSQFVDLFNELEVRPTMRAQGLTELGGKFFGGNAVGWIGLRSGEPTRRRLDAFYSANRVPQPDWAAKVDKMSGPM